MKKKILKLIRLYVATKITHSEAYVSGATRSCGVDETKLTHNQIAIYKATLKTIEADMLIEMAFSDSVIKIEDVDCSPILKAPIV